MFSEHLNLTLSSRFYHGYLLKRIPPECMGFKETGTYSQGGKRELQKRLKTEHSLMHTELKTQVYTLVPTLYTHTETNTHTQTHTNKHTPK
jgi:hypothetical protein